jgi:3-oxoacyl-[acyl-carrier protein] reductase
MDLTGKIALVTGGSRGIGRAICIRLAREGAAVAVNYREKSAEADDVRSQIRAMGGQAMTVQADVSDPDQVDRMYGAIRQSLGQPDILVNNAGLLRRGDLSDFDFSGLDTMRRTNVDGLVHCTRAAMAHMKDRGFGRIINLTSIAAHGTAMAGTTFYAATKAAVSILTRRFAMELGQFGITVNAIAPGFIMTDMAQETADPARAAEQTRNIAAKTMVRRVGDAEDIANAAAFLASPASSFITAQVLTVDGGRMDYIA